MSELKTLCRMREALQRKQDRIEELRSIAERATQILQGTPRATTPSHSRLADLVAQIVTLQNALAEDAAALENLTLATECEIEVKIDDPRTRRIMKARYIRAESWATIAADCHLSQRQIFRLHRNGVYLLSSR